jgi:site-specific DNA recombinase
VAESDQTERADRAQALVRHRTELQRTQARLDVLYEDRLDGRIDSATYDQKAWQIRERQDRIRQKIRAGEVAVLPPISQAVDVVALTSKGAQLFLEQPAAEQRKLLHLVLETASWKGGELRTSLREPFEKLRLSNRISTNDSNGLAGNGPDLSIWRRGGDSNPR